MAGDQETLGRLAAGELRELLQLLDGSDIEELEVETGGTRLHFKRTVGQIAPGSAANEPPAPETVTGVDAAFVVAAQVGFFHYPDDKGNGPVRVGDEIAAEQVLGVIDSLSVKSPVLATRAGVLDEVLVDEGQPVEFGQPLFVVRPGED